MNCYFCNLSLISESNYRYCCNNCNVYHYYDDNFELEFVTIQIDKYNLDLNIQFNSASIYEYFNKIYTFDYIPNITPQNFKSKLNTILTFL